MARKRKTDGTPDAGPPPGSGWLRPATYAELRRLVGSSSPNTTPRYCSSPADRDRQVAGRPGRHRRRGPSAFVQRGARLSPSGYSSRRSATGPTPSSSTTSSAGRWPGRRANTGPSSSRCASARPARVSGRRRPASWPTPGCQAPTTPARPWSSSATPGRWTRPSPAGRPSGSTSTRRTSRCTPRRGLVLGQEVHDFIGQHLAALPPLDCRWYEGAALRAAYPEDLA